MTRDATINAMADGMPVPLVDIAPELERLLESEAGPSGGDDAAAIRVETSMVAMRDGIRLATDLYLPSGVPAPAIAVRTPYGRGHLRQTAIAFAQRGYVFIAQDVRGTGDSEPERWDTYMYEGEDGIDFVEWATRQPWYDGFLGSCGGSYVGSTQWGMSMHPRMSAIAPEVAGLGVTPASTPGYHMFVNAFSRAVGKGPDKLPIPLETAERQMVEETLSGGYFNEPLHLPPRDALLSEYPDLQHLTPEGRGRWLWERYRASAPAQRAALVRLVTGEDAITFGSALGAAFSCEASGLLRFPSKGTAELARSLHAPALIITGWYDWGNADTLATWQLLTREAPEPCRSASRLLIAPCAHNMPGYREGREDHPELDLVYRSANVAGGHRMANMRDLLLRWYAAIRTGGLADWPVVTYYLMGANEWHAAPAWPPPATRMTSLYLGAGGELADQPPSPSAVPSRYTYDPFDPTPTMGGAIVSYVYTPGSVDVSAVQRRDDVLTFTTAVLEHDIDVVGSLRLILFASSSAIDTDFSARLSDVFPDGRAIQLQSATLRARYRNPGSAPEPLEPGRIYRFEIDLGPTANRFKAGHRLRLDISSADFPKFDRNANRGGKPGDPIPAVQSIYHEAARPSHLLVPVVPSARPNIDMMS
nr:CocE/NonD family hydrolase [Sphingomonas sp. Y57]